MIFAFYYNRHLTVTGTTVRTNDTPEEQGQQTIYYRKTDVKNSTGSLRLAAELARREGACGLEIESSASKQLGFLYTSLYMYFQILITRHSKQEQTVISSVYCSSWLFLYLTLVILDFQLPRSTRIP